MRTFRELEPTCIADANGFDAADGVEADVAGDSKFTAADLASGSPVPQRGADAAAELNVGVGSWTTRHAEAIHVFS